MLAARAVRHWPVRQAAGKVFWEKREKNAICSVRAQDACARGQEASRRQGGRQGRQGGGQGEDGASASAAASADAAVAAAVAAASTAAADDGARLVSGIDESN